ncbi:hypothetical protein IAU59_006606 [Kwoniella sp. CBS 9459]
MSTTMTASPRPLTPFPHTHTLNHGQHASYFHHIPFEAQLHAHGHGHAYGYAARPIHFQLNPLPTPTPPSLVGKGSHVSRTPSFTKSTPAPKSPRAGPSSPSLSGVASGSASTSTSASESSSSPNEIFAPSPRRMSSSTSTSTSTSSSYSMASPPMPTTPHLDSAFVAPSPATTPFSLPPPAYGHVHHQLKRTAPSSSSASSSSSFEPIIEVPTPAPFEEPASPSTSFELPLPLAKFSYDPYSTHLPTGEPIATGYLGFSSSPAKRPKFKRRDTPIPHVQSFAQLLMRTGAQEDSESRILRSVIDGGAWVIV